MSPSQALIFLDGLCRGGYSIILTTTESTGHYVISAQGPVRAFFGTGRDLASAIDDLKASSSRRPTA